MTEQIPLVPNSSLESTPSQRAGVPRAVEDEQRRVGWLHISICGILLRLRIETTAAAGCILHRFYYRRSLSEYDVLVVADAAILLAGKMCEDSRRIRDIMNVSIVARGLAETSKENQEQSKAVTLLGIDSAEYKTKRQFIVRVERHILKDLGYALSQLLVSPHRYLLRYLEVLFPKKPNSPNKLIDSIYETSWGLVNDSYYSTLCCELQPSRLAFLCLYVGSLKCGASIFNKGAEMFGLTRPQWAALTVRLLAVHHEARPRYCKIAAEPVPPPKQIPDEEEGP